MLPFWLLWRMWRSRNNLVFNNFRESPTTTVLKAQAETKEWLEATRKQSRRSRSLSPRHGDAGHWQAPERDFVKCNFDAGLNLQNLQGTGGWIVRDHKGFPKVWGSVALGYSSSPLEAETKALLTALHHVWIRGFTNVIFEGDCEILINLLNGSTVNSSIANHLLDIRCWALKFERVQFRFVRRESNQVAHALARFGCIPSSSYVDSCIQPDWLKSHICNDISKLI